MSKQDMIKRIYITYENRNNPISKTVDLKLRDRESYEDTIFGHLFDMLEWEFEVETENVMYEKCDIGTKGVFAFYEEEKIYNRMVFQNIEQLPNNAVSVRVVDKEGKVVSEFSVSLRELYRRYVEKLRECESWTCHVVSVINNSVYQFVKEGKWHFGLRSSKCIEENPAMWPAVDEGNGQLWWKKDGEDLEPVIWFGPDGIKPQKPWIINLNCAQDIIDFWCESEPWYIMETLVADSDDCFLTWYIGECGAYVPDPVAIKENCPISFDERCSPKDVTARLMSFFVAIQNQKSNEDYD